MTMASMIVIRSPLLVHIKSDGRQRANIAAPSTKNGKPEVKVARVASRRLLSFVFSKSSFVLSEAKDDNSDGDKVVDGNGQRAKGDDR